MPEAENPAETFVDREFPAHYRPLLPPAMRRAYETVDHLIGQTDFLSNPSGRCQRGQLIVKAVEHQIFKLIEAGSLPFEPSWEDYASPTGKHLVLRGERCRITVNQVPEPTEKPRYAAFRENLGVNNTRFLFSDWNEDAEKEDALRHLLILHGYQDLTFVHIGFPHPRRKRLVYRTENLVGRLHVVSDNTEDFDREGPTEAPDLDTFEELEKFLRDHDTD